VSQRQPDDTPRCRSCGEVLHGTFCHACGQGHRHVRLSARELGAEVLEEALSFDTRLLRTVRALSVEPARVCRDFLSCRRVPWMHPFKYALLMGAFAFLVQRGLFALQDQPLDERAETARRIMGEWGEVLNFLTMPVFAFMLRLFFPRSGLRWIEHLVVVLYGFGHLFLVQTCLMPLTRLGGTAANAVGLASALLPVGYFAWLVVTLHGCGRVSGSLRALVAWVLANLLIAPAAFLLVRLTG
jgi:hypothetical protein